MRRLYRGQLLPPGLCQRRSRIWWGNRPAMSHASQFQNRYRIASARCPAWDYTAPGVYLVTWCTARRAPVLGRIDPTGVVCLSPLGVLVDATVGALPVRRRGVAVDAGVVMPDHVHLCLSLGEGAPPLAVVVTKIKATVTRCARRMALWDASPLWQARYHDRIIRTSREWMRARRYIAENPIRCRHDAR